METWSSLKNTGPFIFIVEAHLHAFAGVALRGTFFPKHTGSKPFNIPFWSTTSCLQEQKHLYFKHVFFFAFQRGSVVRL
jgi:hypothetical protein